jgi:hypothetical protein
MKRTKRKHILFSQDQWKLVCKRAEFVKMKPATFIRNMSLHKEWKHYDAEDICLPLKIINHIGTDLNMIIRVAENTNSEHLPKLRELKKRYEDYRVIFYRHYSKLLNND